MVNVLGGDACWRSAKVYPGSVPALKERGVDADDYSVQVSILNSEASAIPTQPICIVAMVFPNEKAAFITSYRHTQ
ncbi:hypothetical protein GCM10012280_66980 [Wenjunlia tyrosinilytica]|uniref:Uncharacterized protein n=1 Tax=Wenjunlia tyrosinilytica TaxID=1544741 RepID=A0A917ZWY1_9ACTN|nr:hypothetical protein GCM10012280_66980 [Wenjunlia tyrosinilytica]